MIAVRAPEELRVLDFLTRHALSCLPVAPGLVKVGNHEIRYLPPLVQRGAERAMQVHADSGTEDCGSNNRQWLTLYG